MSNIETVSVASLSPKSTFNTGYSLAASLYQTCQAEPGRSLTIFLRGDLGTGKTTFVQGLGLGLGVSEPIVSPTYALENRYGETLLHMDLFRIDPKEARTLLNASEDFPGVRVIEWSERLEATEGTEGSINITLTDLSLTTRTIEITFADLPLPDRKTIEEWRNEVRLPDHIRKHCDAVGTFAEHCAEEFLRRGIIARPQALKAAGHLHDLLRFIDFLNVEDRSRHPEWVALAKQYPYTHEEACARFVTERRYPGLGMIISPHGLRTMDHPEDLRTIEQKLLFYGDKRVMGDRVVSLEERFKDFVERYGNGVESEEAKRWSLKTQELERELFGENVP